VRRTRASLAEYSRIGRHRDWPCHLGSWRYTLRSVGETVSQTLRRTPLYEQHVAAGAKLVGFAGWEMPIQYAGIREEHLAVRHEAGVFDVSHMGQLELSGEGALALCERLLTAEVSSLGVGEARYSLICDERGGVLDDVLVYRLQEHRLLLVTNCANHARDLAWVQEHSDGAPVAVSDLQDRYAMLAVQGPGARALLAPLANAALPLRMRCSSCEVAGLPVLACGTGYTGEDGLELLCEPELAPALWAAVLEAGAVPAGLGARDTLRIEACLPLYGNDMDEQHDPISAGLGWACAEHTGFIGAEPVAAVRAAGPRELLVPFVLDGPGIARAGNRVLPRTAAGGEPDAGGTVTSGTFSPSLERGVGLAYLPAWRATPGQQLQIDVRGTVRAATVATKPLYPKDR
jgi:aminomethyltransferase